VTASPPDWQLPNILGLLVYRDTNVLDHGRSAELDLLLRLRDEGWVQLATTDTAATEISDASDPATRDALAAEIATGFISMGPMVLGHSQLGRSVLGSDEDAQRLHDVHRLIWNREWEQEGPSESKQAPRRIRDTMHVATAIRYGGDVFVTNDQAVVDAGPKIAEKYRLRICSPARALAELGSEITLMRHRWERFAYTQSLPEWPTDKDIYSWSAPGS